MFQTLTPNLMVTDIPKSVAFYTDVLGFSLRMAVPEDRSEFPDTLKDGVHYVYAQLVYGDVEIMIQTQASVGEDIPALKNTPPGGAASFYGKVENVDEVYAKIKDKVTIVKDLETSWYGMKEFFISDPDGYILGFASPEPKANMDQDI